jgi:transposase-like protein
LVFGSIWLDRHFRILLENFGVERSRKAVYDWVQKTDLQPVSNANPDHIALDGTVIRKPPKRGYETLPSG